MNRARSWRQGLGIPLSSLQDELNRVLAHYRDLWPLGPSPSSEPTELEPSAWTPAVDLVETPDEIHVWVDLPGLDASNLELAVTGPLLTLKGDRRGPEVVQGRGHLSERSFGPFFRQVPLPSEVDVDAVHAESRDGVLLVRLPKAQGVRPRTIPVRTA
jgi:HSP20 family protein